MKNKELKNLALVCATLNTAGLERIVCDLAVQMRRYGLNAQVFAFKGGALTQQLRANGVPYSILSGDDDGNKYRKGGGHSLLIAIKLAVYLKKMRAQVVNVHGIGAERVAYLGAKLAGISNISFVFHSNYPVFEASTENEKQRKKIKRWLCRYNAFVAITKSVKNWAVDNSIVEAEKISVIENAIDTRSFFPKQDDSIKRQLGICDDSPVLIQVGRFADPKNQDVTAKAMTSIVREIPMCQILFVGDGPQRSRVEEIINSNGLQKNVHFLGIRSDINDLLAISDIFLLPSSWEGMPVSMLEAISAGVAVIGTNVKGIRDIAPMFDGCVKLVATHDPDALALSVIEALKDTSFRQEASEKGPELIARNFSIEKMAKSYIKLHNDLPN